MTKMRESVRSLFTKKFTGTLIAVFALVAQPLGVLPVATVFAAPGNTYTVCEAVGPDCAYDSVQTAINLATSGDIVDIAEGNYYANQYLVLAAQQGITVKGAGKNKTVLHLTALSDGFKIQAQNVNLRAFTIDGDGIANYGLRAQGVNNLDVRNVKVTEMRKSGFDINGVTNSYFKSLQSQNNGGNGIAVTDSDSLNFVDTTTTGNSWGGVALYTHGGVYPGRCDVNNVSFSGGTSLSEVAAVYTGLDNPNCHITNLSVPSSVLPYKVTLNQNDPQDIYVKSDIDATMVGLANAGLKPVVTSTSDGSYLVRAGFKLEDAMAHAPADSTINVTAGTYSNIQATGTYASNLEVNGIGNPTIDGLDLTGSQFDGLKFQGFTFTGDSAGYGNFSVTLAADGDYADLTIQDSIFDGQGNAGRAAVFLNRGFNGFTLNNNVFNNYNNSGAYSLVFAEAQGTDMGDHFTATYNTLTASSATNFLEAYLWKNVSMQYNIVNAQAGRLLVWSDDSRSLETVNLTGNTVNVTQGASIGVFYAPMTDVTVKNNTIVKLQSTMELDASQNWWGQASGPEAGQYGSDVNVTPWCDSEDCTSFLSEDAIVTLPVSGGTTATTPAGGSTTLSSDKGSVTIPASTNITATGGTWDGTLLPPTFTSVNIPDASGFNTTDILAIKVGSETVSLSFDQPVRLVLPGQAGKLVGFQVPGGNFTEITNVCSADDSTQPAAPANECKLSVGSDLVVWTKHFTTFATFTRTVVPVVAVVPLVQTVPSSVSSFASIFNVGPDASDTNTTTQSSDVLGTQTTKQAAKTPVVEATTSGWKIIGVTWYWWALLSLGIAVLVWYLLDRRRNTEK